MAASLITNNLLNYDYAGKIYCVDAPDKGMILSVSRLIQDRTRSYLPGITAV